MRDSSIPSTHSMKLSFVLLFSLTKSIIAQRSTDNCLFSYVGDGFCDPPCNKVEDKWDGGDCCAQTCKNTTEELKCGKWGYQCVEKEVPKWFRDKFRLCFKSSPEGRADPDQCGGRSFPHKVCAGLGDYTQEYMDNTDNRPGGCHMRWGLETTDPFFDYPIWFRDLAICFYWRQKPGGETVCRGSTQKSCVKVGEYTPDYIDDSDDRVGPTAANGCMLTWKLEVPNSADEWAQKLMLCLKIESTESMGNSKLQCSNENKSRYCALVNRWMMPYSDGTDHKHGGCKLQWGVVYT